MIENITARNNLLAQSPNIHPRQPNICVGGIMVSIAAFQAVDPGSIPGRRNFFHKVFLQMAIWGVGGTDDFPDVMPISIVDKKNFLNAVTRIRTWVTAATTQGPNH